MEKLNPAPRTFFGMNFDEWSRHCPEDLINMHKTMPQEFVKLYESLYNTKWTGPLPEGVDVVHKQGTDEVSIHHSTGSVSSTVTFKKKTH